MPAPQTISVSDSQDDWHGLPRVVGFQKRTKARLSVQMRFHDVLPQRTSSPGEEEEHKSGEEKKPSAQGRPSYRLDLRLARGKGKLQRLGRREEVAQQILRALACSRGELWSEAPTLRKKSWRTGGSPARSRAGGEQ